MLGRNLVEFRIGSGTNCQLIEIHHQVFREQET
jgi:hypothetical protein